MQNVVEVNTAMMLRGQYIHNVVMLRSVQDIHCVVGVSTAMSLR